MDEQDVTTKDEENVQDVAPEQEEQEEVTEAEESQEEVSESENTSKEDEPEEEADDPQVPVQQSDGPKLDIQSAVNEDGTIDLNKLQDWANNIVTYADQRASTTVDTKLQESQQWERVWNKYPEWKGDKKMRDLVHKQRIGNMYAGGKNDLVKAADTIAGIARKSESEGKAKAQTSITRQKAATLETASNTTDTNQSKRQELVSRISSKNRKEAESARTSLLKDMIASGELKI